MSRNASAIRIVISATMTHYFTLKYSRLLSILIIVVKILKYK